MTLITYTSVCTIKRALARGIYEFRLTKPAGFTFLPGQFVLFNVPLVEHSGDMQTRAFSIASAPFEDDLLFVAKMIPGGRASRWIEERLTEGSSVTFTGPFGRFVLGSDAEKQLLFLGTSTGIAPFRSMIVDTLSSGSTQRMDLVFGVKSEEDLFWHTELDALSKKHKNFFLHVALTQPSASWTGHRGRVQTVAPGIVGNDFSHRSLYVCGSPAMCGDVKALALGEWGVDKKDLHVEGYI